MAKNKDHDCKRCGLCCSDVGTIWVHSKHPVVQAMVKAIVTRTDDGFFRDSGPCDMVVFEESNRAVCQLQKWLGHLAKPESCQAYPFFDDGDKDQRCRREIAADKAKTETVN